MLVDSVWSKATFFKISGWRHELQAGIVQQRGINTGALHAWQGLSCSISSCDFTSMCMRNSLVQMLSASTESAK